MISIRATTGCIGFAACPSSLSTNQSLTIFAPPRSTLGETEPPPPSRARTAYALNGPTNESHTS
jgi:hypothetical protein